MTSRGYRLVTDQRTLRSLTGQTNCACARTLSILLRGVVVIVTIIVIVIIIIVSSQTSEGWWSDWLRPPADWPVSRCPVLERAPVGRRERHVARRTSNRPIDDHHPVARRRQQRYRLLETTLDDRQNVVATCRPTTAGSKFENPEGLTLTF